MSDRPVVAVGFEEADSRRDWISHLAARVDRTRIVDACQVDPSSVDVLVVGNPPGEILSRFHSLRFVQSTWAGVDRLTENAPPIPIARMVAPELTHLMTEFVLAAVLSLHRGFPSYRRDQTARRWQPRVTFPAAKRRVGVLGFGELGRPAAIALAAAGFDVMAWARSPRSGPVEVLAGRAGFQALLGRSDILVNLLPLTAATHGILDGAAFAAMPPGAALVNVARGAHIVDAELLEALDSGRMSDAVLDVFDEEPLPLEHPFWAHEHVTVLPHVAAPSDPVDLAPHVAANIQRFLAGEVPRFLVETG